MSQVVVVRYKAKPECVEENKALIRAVFEELEAKRPEGTHYVVACMDDGVSFAHTAIVPEGANPLGELASFQRFVSTVDDRCDVLPEVTLGALVGGY